MQSLAGKTRAVVESVFSSTHSIYSFNGMQDVVVECVFPLHTPANAHSKLTLSHSLVQSDPFAV